MKKKILATILSLAMLLSVASFGSLTASAALGDGVQWNEILNENFEDYAWEDSITESGGSGERTFDQNDGAGKAFSSYTNNTGDDLGNMFKRIAQGKNVTSNRWIVTNDSVVTDICPTGAEMMKIEFDFAKSSEWTITYFNILGYVNGEAVESYIMGANADTDLVAYDKDGEVYENAGDYASKTWYKITIIADTATDSFDAYCNGELLFSNVPLGMDYTGFRAFAVETEKQSASKTYETVVDNLKFSIPAGGSSDITVSQVTLNTNGGEIEKGNITSYVEGTGATLPTAVTKEYYEFAGWYDNANCTGTPVTEISADATGDKTFYAKWVLATYDIEYVTGGVDVDAATSYTYGSEVTLPTLTREGFTFLGWYVDRALTIPATGISATDSGDKTFYAKYTFNGATAAEKDDNYVVIAQEDFDSYEANSSDYYDNGFKDGFNNLAGTAPYTSFIMENPWGTGRGNTLVISHTKSGTAVYWGMEGLEKGHSKVKFSFDSARNFDNTSGCQLDLIIDGKDASGETVDSQVIVSISKGRSVNYNFGDGETHLTGIAMPKNEWSHFDLYVDAENKLMSLYQDNVAIVENIALEGTMADFAEITGFRFKSVSTGLSANIKGEHLDNVKFAVPATEARVRPQYTAVFSEDFESYGEETYGPTIPGMVKDGSSVTYADPAGINGLALRLRHTSKYISAEMATSGEGSAVSKGEKSEFIQSKFSFDHYVKIAEANATGTQTTYYTTNILLYGDVDGEEANTVLGNFGANAVVYFMDGDTEKAVSTYARETWQNVEVYIDCIEGTYDAYINGKLVVDGFDLPMDYENTYAVRITANRLGSATNSYTYIDNLKFYKSEAIVEGLTIGAVTASYTDGAFVFAADVTGYTKSAQAVVLVGLFNEAGNLVDVVETPYATIKANGGKLVINEALANPGANATVGVFAWNMANLVPLGASVTASIN